jgi:hypothetical protein
MIIQAAPRVAATPSANVRSCAEAERKAGRDQNIATLKVDAPEAEGAVAVARGQVRIRRRSAR